MFVAKDNARLRRLYLRAGAGSITGSDIAPGAIGTTNLATGAVTSAILAPGAAATPAQGALADTALQNAAAFATAAQGALAATAYGWGNHAAAGYQAALWYGLYEQQEIAGLPGGDLAGGIWTPRVLNTEIQALAGATLSGGAVTVTSGTFLVLGQATAYRIGSHRVAIFVGGAPTALGISSRAALSTDIMTESSVFTVVAGPAVIDIRHWVESSVDSFDGGYPTSTGDPESYARLLLIKVA